MSDMLGVGMWMELFVSLFFSCGSVFVMVFVVLVLVMIMLSIVECLCWLFLWKLLIRF